MSTILIVEDSEAALVLLERLFNRRNYSILKAEDFKTAEALLIKHHDDIELVVTDFQFPGGNGNAVARLSRELGIKKVILESSTPELAQPELFEKVVNKSDIFSVQEDCRYCLLVGTKYQYNKDQSEIAKLRRELQTAVQYLREWEDKPGITGSLVDDFILNHPAK